MRTSIALILLFWGLSLASVRADVAPAPAPASDGNKLVSQIDQMVTALARERGQGGAPRLDGPLSLAAADLARVCPDEGPPPGSQILSDAMSLRGVIEPSPYLLLSSFNTGGEQALLDGLRRPLTEALAQGRWRRLGVGVVALPDGKTRVMVMLLESFLELDPLPRSVPLSGPALTVRGKLLPPYDRPQLLVTDPKGKVARLQMEEKSTQIEASFRCQGRGRHQLEVTGEDHHGTTVLANFPLYCGEEAPRELLAPRAIVERPFRDAAEAEKQLLELLNADRARFGLSKVQLDEHLAEVARGHSRDMRTYNYVGHVSPRTGNAGDRARKAGIATTLLLENLARAYSPLEVEKGLMDSPGHRANILNKGVSHVGVGVEMATLEGGVRELWVTQMFMKPAEPFDPQRSPQQALSRVQDLRQKEGRRALEVDPALQALAAQIAEAVGQGKLPEERVGEPVQQALGELNGRFRLLRTVLSLTNDLPNLAASKQLFDAGITHLGVGVAPARQRGATGGVYVVIVLGQAAVVGKVLSRRR